MASRPVFIVSTKAPFVHQYSLNFTYNSGFSKTQKQKNIVALHEEFGKTLIGRQGKKIAEISTKSLIPETAELSAFRLSKFVPSLNKKRTDRICIKQSGIVIIHRFQIDHKVDPSIKRILFGQY